MEVPVVGKIGDRMTTYFGDFGKFQVCSATPLTGGFLLELEMTRLMREDVEQADLAGKRMKIPGRRRPHGSSGQC